MKLFNKDKDLILKITNLVLLLWLVASIVLTYTFTISLIIPKQLMTYKEYKASNCYYYASDNIKNNKEDYCKSAYNSYKNNESDQKYEKKKNIFSFVGSIIIVTGVLYFLNKKKSNNEKTKEGKD